MDKQTNIYGVDLEKDITPMMARDALVECFFQAHCADAGLGTDNSAKGYCQDIVKKSFVDSQGNFEEPTKQSIINAMEKLKEFSVNFRDPSIIQKHVGEMMKIVDKLI